MRQHICILLILFTSVVASAQQAMNQSEIDNLLTRLQANATTIQTIQCNFIQKQHLKVVKNDIVREGNFYFKAEDNVCLKYDKPQGDMILLTGTKFIITTNGKRTVTNAKNNPIAKQIRELITYSVSGNLYKIVGKQGSLRGEQTTQEYVLTLDIKQQSGATINYVVLSFNKKDLSLNNLKIIEGSGNINEYTFIDKRFNVSVDQIFN